MYRLQQHTELAFELVVSVSVRASYYSLKSPAVTINNRLVSETLRESFLYLSKIGTPK